MPYLIAPLLIIALAATGFLAWVHVAFRPARRTEQGDPRDLGLDYREVWIPTVRGKRLYGWFIPSREGAPTAILLHGWGGNAESMLPLAVPFHRAGLNVLLIDARNHGRSDPDTFSSMPRFAEDMERAIDWVRSQGGSEHGKVVLVGHSVGAAAVLLAASRRNDIDAVISIASFAHPESMMRRYLQNHRLPRFVMEWILRYVEWKIGHRYEEIAPLNTACRVPCPVLVVHGALDATVPVTDAHAIVENCGEASLPLLLIEGAGHSTAGKVEDHGEQLLEFLEKAGVLERMPRHLADSPSSFTPGEGSG